jgi:hypothetical protein
MGYDNGLKSIVPNLRFRMPRREKQRLSVDQVRYWVKGEKSEDRKYAEVNPNSGTLTVGGVPGLILKRQSRSPSAKPQWYLRAGGKDIGSFGRWNDNLADIRNQAAELLRSYKQGDVQRTKNTTERTVKDFTLDYWNSRIKGQTTEKYAQTWIGKFQNWVFPMLGDLPISQMDRDKFKSVFRQPTRAPKLLEQRDTYWTQRNSSAQDLQRDLNLILRVANDQFQIGWAATRNHISQQPILNFLIGVV